MKTSFRRSQGWAIGLLLAWVSVGNMRAQITVSTDHVSNNGNGSITFNVQNTNPYDIIITDVSTHLWDATLNHVRLLYNTTPINQVGTWNAGTVGAGQNGWISAGSNFIANTENANGVVPVLSGLSLTIPAGATYGIGLSATAVQYMVLPNGVNTFSAGGVNLLTGTGIGWGGAAYPSTPSGYIRGFVGSITFVPVTTCAAPVSGGTIAASVASVCPNVNFSISSSGMSGVTGTVYQWQSSPDGVVWGNVAGQTSSAFTGSQTSAGSYRLRVICTNGPDTAYSNVVSVGISPFNTCYCTTDFSNAVEPITLVQFGDINNATSGAVNGTPAQENFTAMTTDVVPGLSYPIAVNGNTNGNYTDFIAAYVDWNHNGQYTDAGETYPLGSISNCSNCGVNAAILVPTGALISTTGMRIVKKVNAYAPPCNTVGYGQAENYTIHVLPPPANEAGVLSISKPEMAACSLGQQVWVNLQNLGSNPLASAIFTVKVNGFNVSVSNPWTGNIPPQSQGEIQIPLMYSLADGDSISVEVSQPNGQTEDALFAFNNLAARRVYEGLSGIKTVSGASPDFAGMDAAIQALQLRGVCDTVYFRVAANTYATQHTFPAYPAAGPGRLAVFESATGNATFAFDATSAADNFVFRFNGANGYLVRNFTLQALDPTYAKVVTYANASQNIGLEENTIIGDTTAAYDAGDMERINISGFDNTDPAHLYIRHNRIIGGSRSIDLEGSASSYATDFVLEGNTLEKFTVMGALVANVDKPMVNNNTIRPRAGVPGDVYGLYVQRTIDGGSLSGNDVQTWNPGFLFYLNNVQGGTSGFRVANNFLYGGDTGNSLAYGVYIADANSGNIVIANNSIVFNNDNAASGAITVADGSPIHIFNNNIGAFGNAPALRIEESNSVTASDYNNMYGSNLANVQGTVYTTLAGLQAATARDANSLSVLPGFNGADLHTCVPELNGAGWVLADITADFDGDARAATPDIGADEFLGDANGLLAEDAFLKCPADQVTLGNAPLNGVTYTWTPSGNTSQIATANVGMFIVTATSACGSYSDTATVLDKPLPTASFTATSAGLTGIFTNESANGSSYLWDFGDGAISTSFSPSHLYGAAGTYSVTLTVTNECGSATFGPTAVNVTDAAVEEATTAMDVSVFPNPTPGPFTLAWGSAGFEPAILSVMDVTGKTVLTKNVPAGVNQTVLDATAFAPGVYSVKISRGETVKTLRLIRK